MDKRSGQKSRSVLLWALVAAGAVAIAPFAAAQDPAEQEIIEYSGSASEPIIVYEYDIGLLEGDEDVPRLQIFGDGRVVVNIPAGMVGAGDYELQLTTEELEALLSSLSSYGLFTFDQEAATEEKELEATRMREAARTGQGQTAFYRSDGERTTITVNLSLYKAPGASRAAISNYTKVVSWYGLRGDTKDYPAVRSLTDLAAAEQELIDLCARAAQQTK